MSGRTTDRARGAGAVANPSPWSVAALLIAASVALPVALVVAHVGADSEGIWPHLVDTVLAEYVVNSALLLVGVGVGTAAVGVTTAWLVTMCSFPGRRVWTWALLLPLAMPTYLMAYTYTDLLQFSGAVQSALRDGFGWGRGDYWFPEIRSVGGAIVTFSLVLYPYVYLLARAAFLEQSLCVLEVGRTLGRGPWRSFLSIALPLARPAVAAGVALAMMETLGDYGAVDHFAVNTFTTGIYRSWTALASPEAAAKLAGLMVLLVGAILAFERVARGRARYHHTTGRRRPLRPIPLRGVRGVAATIACAVPVLLGFAVPTGVLLHLAIDRGGAARGGELARLAGNSFFIAAAASVVIVGIGVLVGYGRRIDRGWPLRICARLVSLGYAVPGSVIAVGVLFTLGAFDRTFGTFVGGTMVALLFAYAVRFSSLSLQTVDAGLARIHPSLDAAARTLGRGPGRVMFEVHAPLLRGSVLTAALLVFVDVVKELPATMIVRPFDLETLAVSVHRYASDERLAQSALPALLIVAVGIGPVVLLSRAIDRSRIEDAT
ncbi:MAG: ABC transporter permease [Planctomycetota bacterium JB042]